MFLQYFVAYAHIYLLYRKTRSNCVPQKSLK